MYSSGYSQVSKSSMQPQKKKPYRSQGKSCGYYMRIVFFFSSLIQSLIIVSLVLFLVYGKTQDSASTARIQDLEESFSRLSIENVALRHQRKNLTNLLNATLIEKARNDWDLARIRYFSNISAILIQDIDKKLQQCYSKLFFCESARNFPSNCPSTTFTDRCNCGLLTDQLKARLELVESNFTQTVQSMRIEMDQTAKERDNINLEVIHLRRDKSTHEKEVDFFKQKCKDDFSLSLSGIANVSKAFLEKINSLFPAHIAFQLTCPKQREHLEQIRTNCTSLSMEVEDKLQRYLNNVGGQVSVIQSENSRLKAENWRLSEDYRWCSTNRTGLIKQHKQNTDKLQQKHDEEKERLLMDKMRLNGEIEVLNNNVKYKSKANDHLTEQIKQLNRSCLSKTGFSGIPGSSSGAQSWGQQSAASVNQFSRSASGGLSSTFNKPASTGTRSLSPSQTGSSNSFMSPFNKPASPGMGSSSSYQTGLGSSVGSAFNKPASTGIGTSSSSQTGLGSSVGSAFNKPGLTGTGSSSSSQTGLGSSVGSAFNKPGSTGTGSSSSSQTGLGSSVGSAFNKPASAGTGSSSSSILSTGSGGIGSNKPASTGRGTSAFGTSSGSTGSTNKSGSSNSGFSWLGFGSSNSGQSKTGTGTGTGNGPSTGNSYGGTGSSFGAGRTSGLGGGSINVAQHLRDLQRIINPAGPEENQDLSRMLG